VNGDKSLEQILAEQADRAEREDGHHRLMQQLLEPIIAEARRLEQEAGVPPGTAVIRWEQDERGCPVKAVVEVPLGRPDEQVR
jgi:hypothetical protein